MSSLRKWATPLTVGSFLIMGVTGLLMFFHLDSGFNKLIHEWAGWGMMLGVVAHVVLNWRAFTAYFKRPLAMGIMGLGAVMLALSFTPAGEAGGNPAIMVVNAMNESTVATVSALNGKPLEENLAKLAEAGFTANGDTRFADLSGGHRETQMQLIRVLFAK